MRDDSSDTITWELTLNAYTNLTRIRNEIVSSLESGLGGSITSFTIGSSPAGIDEENTTLNRSISFSYVFNDTGVHEVTVRTSSLDGLRCDWNQTNQTINADNTSVAALAAGLDGGFAVTHFFQITDFTTFLADPSSNLLPTNWSFAAPTDDIIVVLAGDAATAVHYAEDCGSGTSSVAAFDDVCVLRNGTNVTVLAPSVTGVAFGPDILAPNITRVLPATSANDSSATLRLEVVEAHPATVFCNITLFRQNTTFVTYLLAASNFTIEGSSRIHERNLSQLINGNYTLNVTCNDTNGLSTSHAHNFTVNDTIVPNITVEESDVTTDSATFLVSTTETSRTRVYYGLDVTQMLNSTSLSGNGTSFELTVGELQDDTRYYYRVYAVDLNGNAAYSENGSFRTEAIEYRSSGGGGAGGAASPVEGQSVDSDFRAWNALVPGWLRYNISKQILTVAGVEILLDNKSADANLEFKSFYGKPENLPTAPGIPFQYFQVVHKGFDGVASRFVLRFRVPNAWFVNESADPKKTHLYRFERGAWKEHPIVYDRLEQNRHYYQAEVPGFSFFAIAADPLPRTPDAPVLPSVTPKQTPTSPPASEIGAPSPTGGAVPGGVVVGYEQEPWPYWYVPLIVTVLLAALVGVYVKRRRALAVAEPLARIPDDDPLKDLKEYVQLALRAGHKPEDVRTQLIAAGWDVVIVEQEVDRAFARRLE